MNKCKCISLAKQTIRYFVNKLIYIKKISLKESSGKEMSTNKRWVDKRNVMEETLKKRGRGRGKE